MLNYFQGQRFKSKFPQNSAWHNSNFFWNFFSKPSLITNFRVIENSIILKYMLDKRIQQLKTIGVYTPKPKLNNVLIVIQKWEDWRKERNFLGFIFSHLSLRSVTSLFGSLFLQNKPASKSKLFKLKKNNNNKIKNK